MMNKTYKKLILEARKKKLKIYKSSYREIIKIYQDVAKELDLKALKSKRGSLTEKVALDYKKQIDKTLKDLRKVLYSKHKGNFEAAAKAASEIQLSFFNRIGKTYGADIAKGFENIFSRVPKEVINEIISGGFYKDNMGLSDRIWWDIRKMDKDFNYMLKRAIAEKKSAADFAKDIQRYVKPGARKTIEWNKVYGGTSKKQVEYNALRLARTSINHSYFETNRRSSKMNPYVDGIKWELSEQHFERQIRPYGRDECDDFAEQNDYDLGVGVFPEDEIPVPHPNCLCYQYSLITKKLPEIGKELRSWLDGADNQMLDSWYRKYGEHFIN